MLLEYYRQYPAAIVPRKYHTEVVAALERGLEDISISRPKARLSWGVGVPGDEEQTIYVWFDALINYLTVTGFPWTRKESSATSEETEAAEESTSISSEAEAVADLEEIASLTSEMDMPEAESAVEESEELESMSSEVDSLQSEPVLQESEPETRTESFHPNQQPKEKRNLWPVDVHFIGKDIIRYHTPKPSISPP